MRISSPAFAQGTLIPKVYTCDDANMNPPLIISGIPLNTLSLALIVEDPDAPSGTFTHWIVWNISPNISLIPQNSLPPQSVQGTNGFGNARYDGPCPPQGSEHRYYFQLYALNKTIDFLSQSSQRIDFESSVAGYILEQTQLMGTYAR